MSIRIDSLTIVYGNHVAVDGLSIDIPSGTVGLLGRNGAGKSSILRASLGLVRPVAGYVQVLDLPPGLSGPETRARIGYMPERDAHLPAMTGFEMVAMLGMLTGMRRRDAWRRSHEVLYLVGLEEQRYRVVGGYSAGMRQKVKLAAALVHDPGVMFLDEPTNGLDPQGRAEMLELVRELGRDLGKSVVFSTHILQDVEDVCDSVIVLDRGRVVAQGRLAELTGRAGRDYEVRIDPSSLQLDPSLFPGGTVSRAEGGAHLLTLPEGSDPSRLFAAVRAAGGVVRGLVAKRRTLEDVFFHAIGGRAGAGAP
ncbi:MAG: ABC transporter ATP-binding protein [Planctomycetes bacterium]|nr:ABC transporter ATP-binding protein [Planctomycetota bacterium]